MDYSTNHPEGDGEAVAFEPARTPRPRRDGWTAERQRIFIRALAETGCATHAAAATGLSASSAYRLAAKPEARAFARAWDEALMVAHRHMVGLAVERVVHGVTETFWKNGVCVGERRRPSERLHIFLLRHLDPRHTVPPRVPADLDEPLDLPTGELSLLMDDFEDDEDANDTALPWLAPGGDPSHLDPHARA